jgi:hypothetical protein
MIRVTLLKIMLDFIPDLVYHYGVLKGEKGKAIGGSECRNVGIAVNPLCKLRLGKSTVVKGANRIGICISVSLLDKSGC